MGPRRISPERQWQFFASCFPIVSFRDLVMFHGSLGPLTCPRDFFLCGYLKARVYEDKPRILDELKDTVRQHITQINRDPLERIEVNFRQRLKQCVNTDGHHMPDVIFRS